MVFGDLISREVGRIETLGASQPIRVTLLSIYLFIYLLFLFISLITCPTSLA
jgi:hypothetical protein